MTFEGSMLEANVASPPYRRTPDSSRTQQEQQYLCVF